MTKLRISLYAIIIALIISLLRTCTASAHIISRYDCKRVAGYTHGSQHVKRAVFVGCIRYAQAHETSHRYQYCQSLRGRYQQRNACAIRVAFGRHARDAIRVARCESGLSLHAHNGQYLGLFQMGSRERMIYAHGYRTARQQAEAAYRLWLRRKWQPWTCQP